MPLSSVVGASSILRPGVCTSTSRPASPFEGQTIYETDTDLVQVYNGSGWKILGNLTASQTGSVLQIQSTTKTDTFSTTSTSFTDITGLSVSITPKSTTSKIFLTASLNASAATGANPNVGFRFTGGNSASYLGDAAGSRLRISGGIFSPSASDNVMYVVALNYLDSPVSVSSITYQVQMRTSAGTGYLNRNQVDTDSSTFTRAASTITAMEISG